MVDLLIIADDFTGALDTGVQFRKKGAVTCVMTGGEVDYESLDSDIKVLALDAETRHLNPEQAYKKTAEIVRKAKKYKVSYIYKKTDSALRGNIGAELAAVCDEMEGRIHFIPAFPQINRVTRQGIQYVDGIPVGESVFGKDPFEPVLSSDVTEIISAQTNLRIYTINQKTENFPLREKGILLYDAESEERLEEIGQKLLETDELHVCAGCAGMASVLAEKIPFEKSHESCQSLSENLLVVCGSVNPISIEQLNAAQKAGYPRICLKPEEKLNPGWAKTKESVEKMQEWKRLCEEKGICMLDTNSMEDSKSMDCYMTQNSIKDDDIRVLIAKSMGEIVKQQLALGLNATILITGGDTLQGFMQQISVFALRPIVEILPGVVLSQLLYAGKTFHIISKSGGFGEVNLIEEVREILIKKRKRIC